MNTDILIIGSGGAGLSCAISAAQDGQKVIIASKTFPTHSQTCQAQGGINAVIDTTINDSVENFINDTIKAAHGLSNINSVEKLCKNSENTIKWLNEIGVPFSKDDNSNIAQRKFGGTKAKRTCYSSDYTGLKILHTLYDQAIKSNVCFFNEQMLLELIVNDKAIKGAIFLDIKTGEIKRINAKRVVIATGGFAGIYGKHSTNSLSTTGDGIAIAFKAGAKLSNMEFVQFHPTTLKGKGILISESARAEGGYLVDNKGNRFIDELKARDEVARAIFEKNLNSEKVYLDLRHLGKEKINELIPQEKRLVQEFLNINMENELVPITPAAHYTMGGILVDENFETNIKGLYACGECTQSGVHGANRLGGNSLLEIITFGRLLGQNLSNENSKNIEDTSDSLEKQINRIDRMFKEEKENFYKVKEQLQKILFQDIGLFRDEEGLTIALKYIENLKQNIDKYGVSDKSKIYNKNLVEYLEFENIVLISEILVKSAIKREESRGAHYRLDFVNEEPKYNKISISYLENGKLNIEFEEIK